MTVTRQGIYQHAKGGSYTVLFVARNCTNGPGEGRNVVVYMDHKYGYVHVRDEEEFHERVEPDPKLGFKPGVKVPRFSFFAAQLSDRQAEDLYDDLKTMFIGQKNAAFMMRIASTRATVVPGTHAARAIASRRTNEIRPDEVRLFDLRM